MQLVGIDYINTEREEILWAGKIAPQLKVLVEQA